VVTSRFALHADKLHELLLAAVFGNDTVEFGVMTVCPFFSSIDVHFIQISAKGSHFMEPASHKHDFKRMRGARRCPSCCIQGRECLCRSVVRKVAFSEYAREVASARNFARLRVTEDLKVSLSEERHTSDECGDEHPRPSEAFAEFCRSMSPRFLHSSAYGVMDGFTTVRSQETFHWKSASSSAVWDTHSPAIKNLKALYLNRYPNASLQPRVDIFSEVKSEQPEVSDAVENCTEEEDSKPKRACRSSGQGQPKKIRRRIHVCPECDHAFLQRCHLASHIDVVHRKLRSHACRLCCMSFGTRGNLTRHERLVHGRPTDYG